ncbi:MAG: hypothetical protein KTR15_01555 [Phycisphaeraceae bacterium]|nr:hypothetical protein [Phycisphaeraceae bacterium]
MTVRKYGPVDSIDHLQTYIPELEKLCGELAIEKLVPDLLNPISRCITSSAG